MLLPTTWAQRGDGSKFLEISCLTGSGWLTSSVICFSYGGRDAKLAEEAKAAKDGVKNVAEQAKEGLKNAAS